MHAHRDRVLRRRVVELGALHAGRVDQPPLWAGQVLLLGAVMTSEPGEAANDLFISDVLFDAMPQLGWSARADGFIDRYNRQWYEYTGTTYEQMQGWGWQVVHDPTMLPLVIARWGESLAAGKPFEMTFPLRGRDGMFRWFLTRVNPIRDASGAVVRWVGINTDIDEQKRAAQATEDERDGFFELSLELLGIASIDGYFKRLNLAWEHTLGWTREELMSKGWLEFVHPDDRDATIAAGERLASGAALVRFRNRYVCKDGTHRWLEWSCLPVPARGLIYAAARDATAEHHAELALREMAESVATPLDSIGDGVIATDVTGAIERMNLVAQQLTGWTLDEARGRASTEVFKLLDASTQSSLMSPVERCLREGTEVPVADSCAPIRKPGGGQIRGAVLVFRDISAERDAAILHAQYEQKLVLADRMVSVGTLAAGVAHEINNPLTYVMANVELAIEEIHALSGGSASGRMKDLAEILTEAREGAARITKIVRGLKTFSRVDAERSSVVQVTPVIELAINMAFNEIRHRARLVKDFGPIPDVDGDDARLGQVFINLLVNAAQALPEGATDTNEIRISTTTDSRGRAVVEVRDSGPGIAPAVMKRIFDPFFTTKPVGVGTGLGLAICHNIVTGMGGEISVSSVAGTGTTFRVELPPSSGLATPRDSRRGASAVASLPRGRVLVVDDEVGVGMAVRRVLRQHDVTVVTSATDALGLLDRGEEYDVILSDLMMPEMSGMEFYAALERRHPRMVSRVVFVTGGAFTPEAEAFVERVPNESIEKPVDFQALREAVQRFVK
jgi:PAS domain S-box-containing protein